MRRISSHLLSTPRGLEAGKVVTLSDDGVVTDVAGIRNLDGEAGVEFFPGVIVPGFFNAHCHLELSHLRGAIAPGGGFAAFARGMRSARRGKSLPPGFTGGHGDAPSSSPAVFWDAKMWAEGVSAVADVCNGDSTFDLKTRSPIKYRNFCELFGLGADPARAFALRDQAEEMGLEASVTPHSTYSLNRDAFAIAAEARSPRHCEGEARSNPVSIHFLESEQEADLFKKRGPLWEWYAEQGLAPDFLDYGGPAERLVAQTPPDRPVMLIHNCCVTQRDIDIVMEHFTAPVTWVVCPGSNRHISGLVPPVDLLRRNGLRIAVGTDSLASNGDLSMVGEMRLLAGMTDAPLAELLGWTAAGTIAPGHAPGLIHLTGVDLRTLTLTERTKAQRII